MSIVEADYLTGSSLEPRIQRPLDINHLTPAFLTLGNPPIDTEVTNSQIVDQVLTKRPRLQGATKSRNSGSPSSSIALGTELSSLA